MKNKVPYVLFIFVVLGLVIVPVYATTQTYARSWTVVVTRKETFLFWTTEKTEEKTITVTISKEYYDQWKRERLRRYGGEHFRSYISQYVPYQRWLTEISCQSQPVRDIVAQLKTLGLNETNYVNAVAQISAQMTYKVGSNKFAFETMVDGYADCDGFCVFVSSILKAIGYDVVFLIYRNQLHEQIAVYLQTKPYQRDPDYPITYIIHNDKPYYVLECTGQNPDWRNTYWQVGEMPKEYKPYFNDPQNIYVVAI